MSAVTPLAPQAGIGITLSRVAAVTEIVDYLNDQLLPQTDATSESTFSVRAARLDVLANRVEAQVGPFLLGTSARLITTPGGGPEHGYLAALALTLRNGQRVAGDTLLRLQATPRALIAMDRLCRVLHMLNHLLLGREDHDLWLHVSLGHVLAVEAGHGEFFETLLKQCGLGPERILLLIPSLSPAHPDFDRLLESFANYRARGYRIVLDLPSPPAHAGEVAAAAEPDWIRVHARDLDSLSGVPSWQATVIRGAGVPALPWNPAGRLLAFETALSEPSRFPL